MVGSPMLQPHHFIELQDKVKVYIKGISLQLVERGPPEIFKELRFFYLKLTGWLPSL